MIAQIFSRNQILSVIRKTSATFCNGKYSVLNNFCYAEFLAYYTLDNKSICEYKTDELDDKLIDNYHEECLKNQTDKLKRKNTVSQSKKNPLITHTKWKIYIHVYQISFYLQKLFLIMCCFYFILSGMKKNCYQVLPRCIKISCKSEECRMLLTHQN